MPPRAPDFSRVEGSWADRPLFLIGGGPSFRPYADRLDELCQRGRVLIANPGGRTAPFPPCHALCSIDINWVRDRWRDVQRLVNEGGEAYLAVKDNFSFKTIGIPGATYLRRAGLKRPQEPISLDPRWLAGGNSGHAAMNLAYLKAPRYLYLLGMDFDGADGRTHWHDGYPGRGTPNLERTMPKWRQAADNLAPFFRRAGVHVVNYSLVSALEAYKRRDPEELFQ